MKNKLETESTTSGKVAIRNNWLKIFVVVVVTLVLAVKIWQADFTQAFATFDFSDFLALFLALFSIALAVLFYLKATDTSNVFYDNTYRFTREVSEILGRVEAGFGEKLAHLDEGYSGLKTAVEKIPFDRKQAEKDIQEEEQQLQKVEEERIQLIESLAERARIEGKDKERLFDQINKQDAELTSARREIAFLKRRMRVEEENLQPDGEFIHYLKKIVAEIPDKFVTNAPIGALNRYFKENVVASNRNRAFIKALRSYGVIDEDNDLTRKGRIMLRDLVVSANA